MKKYLIGVAVRAALVLVWAASNTNAADTLQRIREQKVLKWGADAEGGAPYVYTDPERPERLIGFEVELAEALARKLGVQAKMVQNQWENLVPALQRGDFDIILNGLEITDEHRQQIAMSRPYYAYAQQIVTRLSTSNLLTLQDLKGKTVGTLSASAAQRLLDEMGGATVKSYPGQVEPFRDLATGRLDAVLFDVPIVTYYLSKEPKLKRSGPAFAVGYYGIGLRKGDEALRTALNLALAELQADGTLEKIYSRYQLWDDNQSKLASYQEEKVADAKRISTLRDWRKYLPLLLKGALVTVELSFLSMGIAVGLGLVLALIRLYGIAPARWLAVAYVEVFRGTPLLIQLYMIYYGLASLDIEALKLNAFTAAVLGLGLNYAAYEAENYRAGIQGIPRGQMEAAMALGMTRSLALRKIVIPQAVRLVIPPVTNDFIALFKDSSLVSIIAMVELTKVYGMLATTTYDYFGLGLMTATLYFVLGYPASLFARYLERKLRYDHR